MTFREAFQQHAENNRKALYTPDGFSLSYFELKKQAEQLNQDFCDYVTNNSKRLLIFILCQQNVAATIAIAAILTGKHAAVLIPDAINNNQLKKLIDNYQPNIIYHTETGSIQHVSEKKHKLHSELCLMLSTSGSTGTPKQVKLSQNNLFENAKSIISYLHIDEKEKAITSLPLSYSYGLSILTSHLLAGASILVTDVSIMTRLFWDQIEQFQISSIAGVPYTYKMFQRLKLVEKTLPYLKTMTQAGGKLDKAQVCLFAEYAQRTNKQFYIMYGQTEATARMAYLKSTDVLKYPESIGIAIPGGSFKLIDENKKVINQAGVEGELVYKGSNVMMGYALNFNDLATEPELKELHTGDLAYRNTESLYFISGRQSRFLKLFGLRVSLIDIEQSLNNKGYEVACSGQDDFLTVLVVSNKTNHNDIKLIEENVIQLIREQLHVHPDVIKVKVCQSFPLNDNSKIDYKKVYEWVMLNE
ncbi:MAG: AMP-binding protein [gamma proteobacterium symbiont of Taylorina sp.]|nr:AMP-binding protein [gamma proteobacterium symbiont of Taylorina sp.]